MNIREAKEEVKRVVTTYLMKDEFDDYVISRVRQRPVLLIGDPGIGKTAIMEQIAAELHIKPITVKSYLPYERVIYNLAERSVNADRLQRFKKKWGGYKRPKAKQPESCQ